MKRSFQNYIAKEDLLPGKERILLAVSGGLDSVVLCELFSLCKLPFAIAHCNFLLRGEESMEDERFVAALADKYKVPFHSISFETGPSAREQKLSIQEAARKLRYNWFEEIRSSCGYGATATAHHRDDAVETFLINIIRGTGISGMHGILPKNGHVIRPLLFAERSEILAFANDRKLEWREDSSNESNKYLRNRVRNKLIPLLRELNPDISATLYRETIILRDVEKIYRKTLQAEIRKILKQKGKTYLLNASILRQSDYPSTLLFEAIRQFGFHAADLEKIMQAIEGTEEKSFHAEQWKLIVEREKILIVPQEAISPAQEYAIPGTAGLLKAGNQKFSFAIKESTAITKDPRIASLDYSRLSFPLVLRHWKEGDRFQPLGMKGSQLVSDFFTNRKYSGTKKKNAWLLESAGQIVWIAGERIDERFKIRPSTKKVFLVSLL